MAPHTRSHRAPQKGVPSAVVGTVHRWCQDYAAGLEERSTGEVPRLHKFCRHNYWTPLCTLIAADRPIRQCINWLHVTSGVRTTIWWMYWRILARQMHCSLDMFCLWVTSSLSSSLPFGLTLLHTLRLSSYHASCVATFNHSGVYTTGQCRRNFVLHLCPAHRRRLPQGNGGDCRRRKTPQRSPPCEELHPPYDIKLVFVQKITFVPGKSTKNCCYQSCTFWL